MMAKAPKAKAKAGKGEGDGEAGGDPPVNQKVTALPTANVLNNLMKLARKTKQDTVDAATELASAMREAVDNKHVHKKAFNVCKSLDRLEPEKLADFFEHFDDYREKMGLNKRAGQVMRMDLDEDGNTNVRKFPQPKGEAAE